MCQLVSCCSTMYLSFFKAGLSLLSLRESLINLSDNVNGRLCSARNATTIASILSTLPKMCTVGVGGTSGVLDGDIEASQYTIHNICCFRHTRSRNDLLFTKHNTQVFQVFQSLNMLFNGTQTTLRILDVNTA